MSKDSTSSKDPQAGVYQAPLEPIFSKILTPFEEFIHRQTTSGMLLMGTAILALIIANSGLAPFYEHLLHVPIALRVGDNALEMGLHHWINDGLMTMFFFVVGLELKREILVGELAEPRAAALPIIAAIGGMIAPALIFLAFNPSGEAARGWGVPMATDIAFAVGVLALLAARVPRALITFLVALAIVDDLGAVLVIALFYTHSLVTEALAAAALALAVLVLFNLAGVRRTLPYFVVAALLWFFLLQSGVHATLAGVLGAFTIPARPKYDPERFSAQAKELISRFDASYTPGTSIMTNEQLRAVVQTLESGVRRVEAPLQRLEHFWHLPVAFVVIPVFALFNAGIPIEFGSMTENLTHPVTLGVTLGLVLGKVIGISGASWLALKAGIARLPAETRFAQIVGVSLLGGIGFTMSIFIAQLGFGTNAQYLIFAKTGILVASIAAGLGGFAALYWLGRR
jgi:NhaA family Na+:H+ antiporter